MNSIATQDLNSRLSRLSEDQRSLLHRQLGISAPPSPPAATVEIHERLAAFLIIRDGHPAPKVGELRQFLAERLPEFMVPSIFQSIEKIPHTPNGKVDRKALASLEIGRESLPSSPAAGSVDTARPDDLERTLLGIWRKALGNPMIGPDDDFFEAGGDSILAIQMIAQAAQVGITVSLTEFFQTPTVSGMAARLGAMKKGSSTPSPTTAVSRSGPVPLSPIQHWFFEQGLGEFDQWNQTRCLPLPAGLEASLISEAIRAVLEIHPALRHAYLKRPAGWIQHLRPITGKPSVEIVDLVAMENDERTKRLDQTLEQLNRSVRMATGELFQSALIRNAIPGLDHLLLTAHHLAVDGISWSILLDDIATACRQLQSDQPVHLPSPGCDFSAWIESLYRYAETDEVAAEVDFWSSRPWDQVVRMPADLSENGSNTEGSAELVTRYLTDAATEALLKSASDQHRTEINELLLAALARAAAEWSGSSSIMIGVEGHGREPYEGCPDCSRTVGWFTSFFPVLLDLPNPGKFSDVINEAKERLREIPQKGLGFGLLKYLTGDSLRSKSIGAIPKPEIVFNYLGNDRSDAPESDSPFSIGMLSRHARSPDAPRGCLFEINTRISGGRLEIFLVFSRNLHRRETAESLVEAMTGFLLEAQQGGTSSQAEGNRATRDFPDAGLDQDDLNSLLDRIP